MATRRMRIKVVANVPLARGRPDRPVTPIAVESLSMPASPLANLASPPPPLVARGRPDRPVTPITIDSSSMPPSPIANLPSPIAVRGRPGRPVTPVSVESLPPSPLPNLASPIASPPVSLPSPRPVQSKTPNNYSTFSGSQNSNSSSDSNFCEPVFFPGKVEKNDENTKHNFKNKFGPPTSRPPSSNSNPNSSGLLASSLQKNVHSTETLKQRLQKPSAAFTLTKYQVARKDFLNKLNSQQETPKRSEMTMLHFAFWNPPNSGKYKIISNLQQHRDRDCIRCLLSWSIGAELPPSFESWRKEKGPRSRATSICDEQEFFGGSNSNTENSILSTASITARRATIGAVPITKEEKPKPTVKPEPEEKKPLGPRVKVGPDGKLIVDTESVNVETTDSVRAKKQLAEMKTVSGAEFAVGSGFYRHKKLNKRGSDWAVKETVRFYRALSTCGTDFSMMTSLFPNRTRAELKSKFKREDRRNKAQVDEALSCQQFNPMDGFSSDEEDILADERHDTKKPKSNKKAESLKSLENIAKKEKNNSKVKPERFYAHPMTKEVMSDACSNTNNSSTDSTNNSASVNMTNQCSKPVNVKVEKNPPTTTSVQKLVLPKSVINVKMPVSKPIDNAISPSKFISDVTRIDIQSTIQSIGKNVFAQKLADKIASKNLNLKPKSKDNVDVNIVNPPKKRARKKKAIPTVPTQRDGSLANPITVTDADVDTRPDILRFDPSDPLGFKIVVPSGGIVIDIKNPERIIQEDQLNEKTQESSDDQTVLNSDDLGPVKSESKKTAPKRKLPFRVPGPGGPPTSKTASLADEIEIEISCN